jgi:hypothetical protein
MSTEGSNPSLSATPIRFASISCRVARRGRLVAYGAALEMRFGATRRGFESPPLRHSATIRRGRARRGTSGALYPQSATAGLNSRSRPIASASHEIDRR